MKNVIKVTMVVGALAGLGYISWKVWKTVKELQEEEILSGEDLELELEKRKIKKEVEEEKPLPEYDDLIEDDYSEVEVDEGEFETYFEDEELSELKYGIDTLEAMEQYKAMKMADLGEDERLYLEDLWTRPFVDDAEKISVMEPGNRTVAENIIEDRKEFFTAESKWTNYVSWAEVILYFADLLDFDLDGGTAAWAKMLCRNYSLSLAKGDVLFHLDGVPVCGIFAIDRPVYNQIESPVDLMKEYNCYIADHMDNEDLGFIEWEDDEDEF